MKNNYPQTVNLLSLSSVFKKPALDVGESVTLFAMKDHEIKTLAALTDQLQNSGCSFSLLEGYCLGIEIPQIGKEFDLIRTNSDLMVNIELKSELPKKPLLRQVKRNMYYLEALGFSQVHIFEFVYPDSLFYYNREKDKLVPASMEHLISYLSAQGSEFLTPDEITQRFEPKNVLVSPFNHVDRFLNNEYYLTQQQETIHNEFFKLADKGKYFVYALQADAGAGKTLLLYDMAKELCGKGKKCLIIHTGKKNKGQYELEERLGCKIVSVGHIQKDQIEELLDSAEYVFVDEAQRIYDWQLELLLENSQQRKMPMFFSFDPMQYLHHTERKNIADYIKENYPDIPLSFQHLRATVRANPEVGSFISKMFGRTIRDEYSCYSKVSIECLEDEDLLKAYLEHLKEQDWVHITFSASSREKGPMDFLSSLSELKVHDVIGQEFDKVVCVMDSCFSYVPQKKGYLKLTGKKSYYIGRGMLYEILTRARKELKIIVYQNTDLYKQLQYLIVTGALPVVPPSESKKKKT